MKLQYKKLGSFRDKDKMIPGHSLKSLRMTEDEVFSHMGQTWMREIVDGQETEKDQYGFRIVHVNGRRYSLFHNDEYVISTYTLQAIRSISRVLLNDKIRMTNVQNAGTSDD
jgi:hypothetical protein